MRETELGQAEPSLLHAGGGHLNNAKPQARRVPDISERLSSLSSGPYRML